MDGHRCSGPSSTGNGGKKAVDPKLAKYVKMRKMGMPDHAIINKMRLDGMEKSMIHKFETLNDEEEESEDDDVDLKAAELAKYHRMKKMGMPSHAITNKMKMDGVAAKIIAAFFGGGGSGGGSKAKHQKQRSMVKPKITPNVNMKRFFWQTVDYKAAKDSIWRKMDESSVTEALDVQEFEGLFCIPQRRPPPADEGVLRFESMTREHGPAPSRKRTEWALALCVESGNAL